jgi:GDPmannose 4,6-dehydratase
MKALIFGVTGQDGSHLADLLLSKNYEVIGVSRRTSTDNTCRIKSILSNPKFKLIEGDITDISSILNILSNEHIDEIYNLAAQSHVGTSFKQPALTWDVTGKGCINILQAIVDLGLFHIRFYQASSSEMFGSSYDEDIKNGIKYQNENTKLMPNSPYAIAKCAAHYAVRMYRDAYNLHASSGILFNHEGPRRGDNFVTKKIINWILNFTKWIKDNNLNIDKLYLTEQHIYSGLTTKIYDDESAPLVFPKLRLGNIHSFRDWGYAGDYVEAMWMMLQQKYPDDYVICTGETHTVAEFLDIAFNCVNIPEWRNLIFIDPEFYRPSEVDYLRGDCSKAKNKLCWSPKHDLTSLIKMMLQDEKL